jgi:hypothetical protein
MKRKKQKGQGLVEFALILPILLLVIVGTMEFGRIFLLFATVSNGAREGARYGMVNPTDTAGIIARVSDTLVMTLPENLSVAISYDSGPGTAIYTDPDSVAVGHRVIVEVQYRVYAMTPFFEPFIPDDFMVDVRNARTIQSLKQDIAPPQLPPGPPPSVDPSEEPSEEPSGEPSEEPSGEPSEVPTDEFGNTVTPTPTATPRPFAPIIIDKPLWANTNLVCGTAEPNQVLTLRIVQTGYQLSGSVDAAGNFCFTVWPLLVGGHTVIVQGYGTQDLAVVQVPTPTPTPIATPSEPYIRLSPTCTDNADGLVTITVTGDNWSSAAKDIYIYWDDDLTDAKCVATLDKGAFSCSFSIYVTEGVEHTVTGIARKNNGDPVDTPATAPFQRPCPGTTPTPSPTPSTLPDLQITGLSLNNELPLGTYDKLYVTVGIRNVGDTDVSSLFWVDLYADPTGVLTSLGSIDYVAINAIAAGSTVSFTMYVPNGFKEVGNHTVQAKVDTWDQILEADETNNISALLPVTVTVSNPAPVPTPTPYGTLPPPGNIQGVTYLNTLPQSNVAVYVFAVDGRMVGSGRSDADGNYVITNVPASLPDGTPYTVVGELRLVDTLYYGQVTLVDVTAGQTTTGVNIDLVEVEPEE